MGNNDCEICINYTCMDKHHDPEENCPGLVVDDRKAMGSESIAALLSRVRELEAEVERLKKEGKA